MADVNMSSTTLEDGTISPEISRQNAEKLEKLYIEVIQLKEDISSLTQQVSDKDTQINSLTKQIESLKQDGAEKDETIAQLRQRNEELESAVNLRDATSSASSIKSHITKGRIKPKGKASINDEKGDFVAAAAPAEESKKQDEPASDATIKKKALGMGGVPMMPNIGASILNNKLSKRSQEQVNVPEKSKKDSDASSTLSKLSLSEDASKTSNPASASNVTKKEDVKVSAAPAKVSNSAADSKPAPIANSVAPKPTAFNATKTGSQFAAKKADTPATTASAVESSAKSPISASASAKDTPAQKPTAQQFTQAKPQAQTAGSAVSEKKAVGGASTTSAAGGEEKEIRQWIQNTVNDGTVVVNDQDLKSVLRDGQALCKLANKLRKDKDQIRVNGGKFSVSHLENINSYLKVCADHFKMPQASMFATADLYEGRDMAKVLKQLQELRKIAK
ncbi:hypothetical protein MP228_013168 [Amoeboaphelidium protococcarum]|nr:hypothetical protein MP228_013168 [Amoeboaphelidium protococcarum]